MKILLTSHYFPSIAYFALIDKADEVMIDVSENYEKQSFRNRAVIYGANGPLNLTIPIQHLKYKMPTDQVQVDFKQKWVNTHWRAIQSAYGKAPFYDYYADYFKDIVYSEAPLLLSYNQQILTICLKLLQISPKLSYSDKYFLEAPDGFIDHRAAIHPKKAKGNLAGFDPKPYTQIFGNNFVPNLSILDLLFCEGPNAMTIIRGSFKNGEQ